MRRNPLLLVGLSGMLLTLGLGLPGVGAASLPATTSSRDAAPTIRPGDLVTGARVSVVAPPRGQGAIGIATWEGGGEMLQVTTSQLGSVAIRESTFDDDPDRVRWQAPSVEAPQSECVDDDFVLYPEGYASWDDGANWWFKAASTPTELTQGQAEGAIVASLENIGSGHNECGRPDAIDTTVAYSGRTAVGPTMLRGANSLICDNTRSDGMNVVGFAARNGVTANTCLKSDGTNLVEVDIALDKEVRKWYVQGVTPCGGDKKSVEATLTHELGHGYGLDHVAGSAELTMSDNGIPNCQNTESTLGLGDLLGLESQY